jgi:hypothetical protein
MDTGSGKTHVYHGIYNFNRNEADSCRAILRIMYELEHGDSSKVCCFHTQAPNG